jgi:FkbM family methyltransferase
LLEQNLLKVPPTSHVRVVLKSAAVSATSGLAYLDLDKRHDNAHSAFIVETASADTNRQSIPVEVAAIDDIGLSAVSPIALKIDIEGEELNALRGARRALRDCPYFVVQFEAHPEVAARTKNEPSDCLSFLKELGAEDWCAFCERTGDVVHELSAARPFFSQVNPTEIYDVIAVCRNRALARGR